MQNICVFHPVNAFKDSYHFNKDGSIKPVKILLPNDSFELSTKESKKTSPLDRIIDLITGKSKYDNQFMVSKKSVDSYKDFVSAAERKICYAKGEYDRVNSKAKKYMQEGQELLKEAESADPDSSIRSYALIYKGSKYVAVGKVNKDGNIERIFHAKDGKIQTVYDVKSPLKAHNKKIINNIDADKFITADCYFYNYEGDSTRPLSVGFIENVTNTAFAFNATFDADKGGSKRVIENLKYIPNQSSLSGIEGKVFKYSLDKKNSNEEIVKTNFEDGHAETRYSVTRFKPIGKTTKTYFKYEFPNSEPFHRLIVGKSSNAVEQFQW